MKIAYSLLILAAAIVPSLSSATGAVTADEENQTAAAIVSAVESVTGWTADELKAGLDRLDVLYQNDMKTADGRKRWHGPVVRTEFNTNDLVKVYHHEDGFTHSEAFQKVTVPTVQEQLSDAEKRAREEAARLKKIADLEEHFEERVKALMKQRQWPEPLARLYLENDLTKLKGTVTVEATITPQE